MDRKTVSTKGSPAAIGPYSQAVRGGGLIFVSGQIPLDPDDGRLVTGDIATETKMVLTAAARILEAAGSSLDRAVRVTVYMTDLGLFGEMNEVYGGFFPANPPARSVVGAAELPRGAAIEVEVTALEG